MLLDSAFRHHARIRIDTVVAVDNLTGQDTAGKQ